MSFSQLGLSDKVLAAVEATGYTTPTPIQEQAIPHVLARRDVLGIAQTGTGKTAAFVLPMLTLLEKGRARARMPRTLILEPTRELAAQVEESFTKYGAGTKLNVALLIGGVSFGNQDTKLSRGVDVLIATPGRLLDHTERGGLLLTGVELLVIDEADRMLDMGFIPDIERICKLVPFTRQTLFFTATMPPEIRRITETFLHNPVKVEVSKPASTGVNITQLLVAAGREPEEKRDVLRRLIKSAENLNNGIIFCNRKREVALLHKSLVSHGFNAVALHGDMEQSARTAALDAFRKGEVTLLVASDVAARGLDIPAVSHVFNFDVPHHADDYVHRIGRTGRAGRAGAAFTLVSSADTKSVAAIEKLTGLTIPWAGEPARTDASEPEAAEGRGEGRSEGRGRSRGGRSRGRSSEGKSSEGRSSESRASEPKSSDRKPEHKPAEDRAPRARHPASQDAAAPVSRLEEARSRRQPAPAPQAAKPAPAPAQNRNESAEEAELSRLPAFLLRPVRIKA